MHTALAVVIVIIICIAVFWLMYNDVKTVAPVIAVPPAGKPKPPAFKNGAYITAKGDRAIVKDGKRLTYASWPAYAAAIYLAGINPTSISASDADMAKIKALPVGGAYGDAQVKELVKKFPAVLTTYKFADGTTRRTVQGLTVKAVPQAKYADLVKAKKIPAERKATAAEEALIKKLPLNSSY